MVFEQHDQGADGARLADLEVAPLVVAGVGGEERHPAVHDEQLHRQLGRLAVTTAGMVEQRRADVEVTVGRRQAEHPQPHPPLDDLPVQRGRGPRRLGVERLLRVDGQVLAVLDRHQLGQPATGRLAARQVADSLAELATDRRHRKVRQLGTAGERDHHTVVRAGLGLAVDRAQPAGPQKRHHVGRRPRHPHRRAALGVTTVGDRHRGPDGT
jgi:hypothetical protein